jgi:hypothetical protein
MRYAANVTSLAYLAYATFDLVGLESMIPIALAGLVP